MEINEAIYVIEQRIQAYRKELIEWENAYLSIKQMLNIERNDIEKNNMISMMLMILRDTGKLNN